MTQDASGDLPEAWGAATDGGADAAGSVPAPEAAPPAAEAPPALPSAPSTAPAASIGEPRRWWHRFRRVASYASAEERYDGAPVLLSDGDPNSLLNKSPFSIGFFATLGGLVAVALVAMIGALQGIVILVILALFLALGLNPAVDFLHRRGIPRHFAVGLVAVLFLAFLALGIWAVVPVISQQVNLLVRNLPNYLNELRASGPLAEIEARYGVIGRLNQIITSGSWVEGLFGGLLGAGMAIANVVFSLVITLVLTLYFLASLPSIKAAIYDLAPASQRPRVRYLANEIFRRIGGYVVGLFIVVACAGTTAFIFLSIVGLGQLSLALAFVVVVFAFIPIVGPTTSMLIVSLIAYSISPPTGVATLVFFLIYQQVDVYVLQPRIFQRSVNVPGALVVLAALSGGLLFGIAGALIAIPTAASLLLLYREVLIPELDRR